MARSRSRPYYCQRSLPEDGCGWVVTMDKTVRRRWRSDQLLRYAGGIYRSKDYAQSLCRSPQTVCALVVWDEAQAQIFFENALADTSLSGDSIRDLMYHFGTEVSRKLMRRKDG